MEEEDVLSLVLGMEGCREESSIAEFQNVIDDDCWSSEKHGFRWVFWREETHDHNQELSSSSLENLKCVLQSLTASYFFFGTCLVQFWAPKVIGEKSCLRTSDQPFALYRYLPKGLCRYRKYCMDFGPINVGEGAKEEELGPIGRVFRNEHAESSPDVRFYSATEHPLRDEAARCGVKGYVALPVFDLHGSQCLGVLELLSPYGIDKDGFVDLDKALKKANLRSTHIDFGQPDKEPQNEIKEMLGTAIDAVPQLHLAQVWVPCKQCANMGNNLSCMERAAFIAADDGEINSTRRCENRMSTFIEPSEFHNVQSQKGVAGIVLSSTNKSCFCRNICDLSLCDYPLAHYARRARLSFCFAIYLQSVHKEGQFCILEFFLQCPESRDDVSALSILHLLFIIMDERLSNYRRASGQWLPEELEVKVGKKNKLASCELSQPKLPPHMIVSTMTGYKESDSSFNFILQKEDWCWLEVPYCGFIVWERKELLDVIEQDIKLLLQNISSSMQMSVKFDGVNYLVQFWALKRIEDRCYLKTWDQPFAVGALSKGLCCYKRQCMAHEYFVGEGAKEEEIGPPGRVFRNRFHEFSPDLRLYSTREFPLRDKAAHCGLRKYLALPIFDLRKGECIGVLEWIGFSQTDWCEAFKSLEGSLKETTNINLPHMLNGPSIPWLDDDEVSKQSAINEIKEMLEVVGEASELVLAQVWVPCSQCHATDSNLSCAKRVLSKNISLDFYFREGWYITFPFCQVQSGKGIAGIVLASENKSCLFPRVCDFSITEEPRAHYAARERLDVCFAICLQSSYTGNKPYILEFFLDPACRKYAQLCSFIHFLQSVMKRELKSFKYASGNQIGDGLVVEVIKFGENNELFTPFESHQPVGKFPFKFKVISYAKEMEHQVVLGSERNALETEQNRVMIVENLDKGLEVTTEESIKERNETSFDISYEVLKQHFGKKIADVATELGVSRSTFKRIIRRHRIPRWPSNEKNKNHPSISERSTANKRVRGSKKKILVSTSNSTPPSSDQNVPCNTDIIRSSQYYLEMPKADDFVIILAKFGENVMKFKFCRPWKMKKLIEEVAGRFRLQTGSFKLKYIDEVEQLISLPDDDDLKLADDDLKLCIETLTSLGKTPIQILVQSI